MRYALVFHAPELDDAGPRPTDEQIAEMQQLMNDYAAALSDAGVLVTAEMLERSGVAERLLRSLAALFGRLPGGYAFAVAIIGVFIFVPMLLTIWLSVQDWSTQTGFETARFVGLDNFFAIFGPTSVGRDFKAALVNTAVYTAISVVVILPLSVGLGLLVHQRRVPGGIALRTVLFSTYMVPMIAVALVFSKYGWTLFV